MRSGGARFFAQAVRQGIKREGIKHIANGNDKLKKKGRDPYLRLELG